MLPKNRRLTRLEVLQTKSSGQTHSHTHYSLVIKPGTGKYGVVTSTKLDKRSVVRNRLRRRIFAALWSKQLPYDIVIFPRKSMLNLKYAQIRTCLDSVLSTLPSLVERP